jgi:rfaE bifunctional protein kinase chain/domain
MRSTPWLAPDRLEILLSGIGSQHVLVVGDMVADEYIYGTPQRISREAPVVILEFNRRSILPGGATNVAVNLRALGASVSVVGVIGDDESGRELGAALAGMGIGTTGLVVDPDRPTSTKTRIVGGGVQVVQQQIVRIDRMSSDPLAGAPKDKLLREVALARLEATALILSDYEHGVIDPEVGSLCLEKSRHQGLVTTVDAHGDLFRFKGMTLATPNQPEAEATLGRPLRNVDDLCVGCAELIAGMQAQGVLITRGSQGLVALDRNNSFTDLPALNHVEVRDATGAGDTVAAVATLILGSGGTLDEAAVIGNVAASLVVRHFGAATVSRHDISRAMHELEGH